MKKIIPIVLLLGYCVPYTFLAMKGDADTGTMSYYGLLIVAFAFLSFLSKRTRNRWVVIPGNTVSMLLSVHCRNRYRVEKWDWYFKPLTDLQLLLAVSALAALLQVIYVYKKKKEREP